MVENGKLTLLSTCLATVLKEVVSVQDLVKYLSYISSNDPLSQPDVTLPATNLLLPVTDTTCVYPTPFYPNSLFNGQAQPKTDNVELHIWYPKSSIEVNGAYAPVQINFDIICARSLWLCSGEKVRPYEIMQLIVNHFDGFSVGTVGQLRFREFVHLPINQSYDAVRLYGEMKLFG